MAYGFVLYFLILIISIYTKTYTYIDEEHKAGMTRLGAVIIGTAIVAVLAIFLLKMVLSSLR